MRRKSAGKKLMAVLIAASLALTPAELTVAAEMEPEGEEAAFLAEESGDTASSDPEDTAETETEITDGSAATEEQETTDTDKPDTGNNVRNGVWLRSTRGYCRRGRSGDSGSGNGCSRSVGGMRTGRRKRSF